VVPYAGPSLRQGLNAQLSAGALPER
jgi:hypothetical protein